MVSLTMSDIISVDQTQVDPGINIPQPFPILSQVPMEIHEVQDHQIKLLIT